MRRIASTSFVLFVLAASVAHAEDPNAPPPQYAPAPPPGQQPAPPPQDPAMQPAPGQQPAPGGGVQVVEQQQVAPVEDPSQPQARGLEYGAHFVVPVFLNQEGRSFGLGGQLRAGWEFTGGFSTELNVGLALSVGDDREVTGDAGLSLIWIGAGMRYSFFNPSALVPFLGAGIALNLWNECVDTGSGRDCGGTTEITFGVNGTAGIAYELSRELALEAGAQVNVSFGGGNVTDGTALFVSPFVGGTLYY